MSGTIRPHRLLVLGPVGSIAAAIGAQLITNGVCVGADREADAVVIDGADDAATVPFLDLTDADFGAQLIDATVRRVAVLQSVLPRLAPGAGVVIVGSDAHLGQWHATGQAAASAALVGIMRSVAMEYGRLDLRANLIALPLGTTATDTALVGEAVVMTAALFEAASITGETVLIDGGANLKFRQARRR